MFKKLFLTLLLFSVLPVFAGEFEDASISNERIFLYMYTPECSYCQKFEPTYDKLLQKFGKNCKFLKMNAATDYGNAVMQNLNAFYVPFVVLINNQKQTMQRVTPTCLMNYACVKDAVDKFTN